jgi:cell division protein FtsL
MSLRIGMLLLAVLVVISAIGVIEARHHHRQHFIQLTELESERDELNIEFGRLQLEQATWGDASRVEQIARDRLGMVSPAQDDIVVVGPGEVQLPAAADAGAAR